ncbi:MAG: sigma 54-interacting transcriptional regulator, partial [Planctomycetes bacterium]|nr:sigma 54-interacting transcriptional regulator [Planctomycetota bacterium]
MNDRQRPMQNEEPVLIAKSPAMRQVLQLAHRAARSNLTVLIQGETGTGKELLARTIHRESPRSAGPFVPVHCGGYTDSLLASELFGHVRGAFTGAVADRPGVFEVASGGTVFLDEISTMSQEMQVKLLRVLQERRVVRVGSSKEVPVDARVVAATNSELAELVRTKAFREDLYYRIKVVSCDIPPLRGRIEDIKALIDHFMSYFSQRDDKKGIRLTPATERILLSYRWPGNIRQLRSELERIVAMADDGAAILETELSEDIRSPAPTRSPDDPFSTGTYQELVDAWTRKLVAARLAQCGGSVTETAKSLRISRTTLY